MNDFTGPSNFRLALRDKAQRLEAQITSCPCAEPTRRCPRCEAAIRQLSQLEDDVRDR